MPRLDVVYAGFDQKIDALIVQAVGKMESGSGGGFGERDIGFTFRAYKDAEAAARRVRRSLKAKRKRLKFKCSIERDFRF
jgi:DNA-binding PucR family transcriptional regulator